jgi:hypothetical protein
MPAPSTMRIRRLHQRRGRCGTRHEALARPKVHRAPADREEAASTRRRTRLLRGLCQWYSPAPRRGDRNSRGRASGSPGVRRRRPARASSWCALQLELDVEVRRKRPRAAPPALAAAPRGTSPAGRHACGRPTPPRAAAAGSEGPPLPPTHQNKRRLRLVKTTRPATMAHRKVSPSRARPHCGQGPGAAGTRGRRAGTKRGARPAGRRWNDLAMPCKQRLFLAPCRRVTYTACDTIIHKAPERVGLRRVPMTSKVAQPRVRRIAQGGTGRRGHEPSSAGRGSCTTSRR